MVRTSLIDKLPARRRRGALAGLVAAALAGFVIAADEAPKPVPVPAAKEVSIPFANRRGIIDWVVADEKTLLLRDMHGQWYRAQLQVPLAYFSYSERLRFATGPSGSLERYDAVILGGQRYPIVSLTRSPPPGRPSAR